MTLFPYWNAHNTYGNTTDPITDNKKHSSQLHDDSPHLTDFIFLASSTAQNF
jgi:hypothetical protein